MIIKIKTMNGWQMFDEIESLDFQILGECDVIGVREDAKDFTNPSPIPAKENLAKAVGEEWSRALIWAKPKGHAIEDLQIIAYRPVYLLNNDGRTIETI